MKNAFTLAEVLVTLGIIGVVAAMTVPNLMENYQRQSYITQLRKTHSELSQAAESAMNDSNTQRFFESQAIRRGPGTFISTYFKTTKTCSSSEFTDCLAASYNTVNGTSYFLSFNGDGDTSCAVLASGSAMCIMKNGASIIATVDINGKQGPNVYGRDLFHLSIENDGSVTSVVSPDNATSGACQEGDYGECFAKILNDGWVMDY